MGANQVTASLESASSALGIRFNGVLLHGPPGTGKTFFAIACAGEFKCNFISVGSADIMSAYVGDSPRLVAAAFDTAKENRPVILFFDEFDAIAQSRSASAALAVHVAQLLKDRKLHADYKVDALLVREAFFRELRNHAVHGAEAAFDENRFGRAQVGNQLDVVVEYLRELHEIRHT